MGSTLGRHDEYSSGTQIEIHGIEHRLVKRGEVVNDVESVLHRVQLQQAVAEVRAADAEIERPVSGGGINEAVAIDGGTTSGGPKGTFRSAGSRNENPSSLQGGGTVSQQPPVIVEGVASVGAEPDVDLAVERK